MIFYEKQYKVSSAVFLAQPGNGASHIEKYGRGEKGEGRRERGEDRRGKGNKLYEFTLMTRA